MVFHVLAVDDMAMDRKIIECCLKKSSCQVTCVDSGLMALQLLGLAEGQEAENQCQNPAKVDMIITDYSMPGMTGYELLKKLKGSKNLKDIPIVIMSSESISSRIEECLEGGAEKFFLKPVKLSDLERLKSQLLSKTNKLKLPITQTSA